MAGMIKQFFYVGNFGEYFLGISFFRVISVNAFWKFLWLGNSAWDSWGVKVWSRDVFGFCLKP